MLRSCTVQVNLDYEDERDMARKFRTSLALQPIATALFANSPFKDGGPSGLKSTRRRYGQIPTPTDAACPALFLMLILAVQDGWIIFWMCPCIFCIAAMTI